MVKKSEVPTTLDELRLFSSKLFAHIEKEPRAINDQGNRLVEPINLAWEATQSGQITDSDVIDALKSPQNFFEKLAPTESKHTPERRISGLGEKIGMFLGIEKYHDEVRIQKVYKKRQTCPEK